MSDVVVYCRAGGAGKNNNFQSRHPMVTNPVRGVREIFWSNKVQFTHF